MDQDSFESTVGINCFFLYGWLYCIIKERFMSISWAGASGEKAEIAHGQCFLLLNFRAYETTIQSVEK